MFQANYYILGSYNKWTNFINNLNLDCFGKNKSNLDLGGKNLFIFISLANKSKLSTSLDFNIRHVKLTYNNMFMNKFYIYIDTYTYNF